MSNGTHIAEAYEAYMDYGSIFLKKKVLRDKLCSKQKRKQENKR